MSLFALILLSFSMSMDAFAAAICKGASANTLTWRDIVLTALLFGVVETIMPVVGWWGGYSAQGLIADYDHWIAFVLLVILGGRMVRESLVHHDKTAPDTPNDCCCQPPVVSGRRGVMMLFLTAFATSIDSMVVGVGLAFLNVDICLTAISIGLATTVMAGLGMSLGKWLGNKAGKRAALLGGLVLIGIGTSILVEHLRA